MKLLIVESPSQASRIASFLGAEWRVEASRGHLRDLPEGELGVDLKRAFALDYRLLSDQHGTLARLQKLAAEMDEIYLGTDPDREGEGIAWHLADLLKSDSQPSPFYRVTFSAITKRAVQAGLAAPRRIDQALVDAGQTRRTLDRLVGYLVSPLACQKLDGRYSAGRVQSAGLRLVVERERDIATFKPAPYWTLDAQLEADGVPFTAQLSAVRKFRTTHWPQAVAEKLAEAFHYTTFTVADVKRAEAIHRPLPPFTTATLQQAASKALGLTPDGTMHIAQSLYEQGFITYLRTDGVFVAPKAQAAARAFIKSDYGPAYVPTLPQLYVTRTIAAQEAHEAIRPTDVTVRAETWSEGVGRDLYALIWKRFVAAQMADARYTVSAALLHAAKNTETRHPARLIAKGRSLLFDGFLKVHEEALDKGETRQSSETLPAVRVGQVLQLTGLTATEHTPEPPLRYTDAALVAALEAAGIGRPSTYASTVRLLRDKGYVKVNKQRLLPTATGIALNDFLASTFPTLFEPGFTASLEAQLDQIASGKAERLTILNAFWNAFAAQYRPLAAQSWSAAPPTRTPKVMGSCPRCGANLVERRGKGGVFAGCERFPRCNGRAEAVPFTAVQKGTR